MIEALEVVSRDCFRSFAVLRNATVIDGEATGVITGLPLTFFNGIGTARFSAADADRRVDGVIARFRAREQSFRWWVTPGSTPSNLGEVLPAHGVRFVYTSAGMTVNLARIAPVPSVPIRQVRGDAEMETFADILTTVFDRPKSDGAIWVDAYSQIGYEEPSPWAHFIAYDGDTPAATASVLLCGEVCGIYLVGTLASARGRGLGTAATLAALHHARARGASVGALQSSEMGERVYRAMGFVSHGMLAMYEWRYNTAP
ncbi:MAG TPA: GNAT family N-acetyltransferase [Thermoanaerobaculia bacterium]|nr:GNAT family N-acetyltransferase [Thermoanaerobaculia bacterium]